MEAMCEFLKGNDKKAGSIIRRMIHIAELNGIEPDIFYYVVAHYFDGMAVMQEHERVIQYLKNYYDGKYVERVNEIFIDRNKIIVKQYPSVADDEQKFIAKYCPDFLAYQTIVGKRGA